jgi:hypothetical protein
VPAAAQQLVLLVPGLSGPESDHPITDYFEQRPVALDRLLSRSHDERVLASGLEATLAGYFGIGAATDLPVAPLSWLADTGEPATQYLLRADPVHLRADQSSLRLFDAHSFSLAQDEADALVASINDFNAAHGCNLASNGYWRFQKYRCAPLACNDERVADVVARSPGQYRARGAW